MLTLPIKKRWFDMILSGEKKEEYREIKPYYTSRFQSIVARWAQDKEHFWDGLFQEECRCGWYDCECDVFEVKFRNGYSANSPAVVAKVTLCIGQGKPEWGAEPRCEYYILKIHALHSTSTGADGQ